MLPSQNADELRVTENEAITVLLDECDEDGWVRARSSKSPVPRTSTHPVRHLQVMGLNARGEKGFVPQNYVQMAGEGGEEMQRQESVTSSAAADYNSGGHCTESQRSFDISTNILIC